MGSTAVCHSILKDCVQKVRACVSLLPSQRVKSARAVLVSAPDAEVRTVSRSCSLCGCLLAAFFTPIQRNQLAPEKLLLFDLHVRSKFLKKITLIAFRYRHLAFKPIYQPVHTSTSIHYL